MGSGEADGALPVGPDRPGDEAVVFLAVLIRLQREMREIDQELARIEVELHEALNDRARERFEAFR